MKKNNNEGVQGQPETQSRDRLGRDKQHGIRARQLFGYGGRRSRNGRRGGRENDQNRIINLDTKQTPRAEAARGIGRDRRENPACKRDFGGTFKMTL